MGTALMLSTGTLAAGYLVPSRHARSWVRPLTRMLIVLFFPIRMFLSRLDLRICRNFHSLFLMVRILAYGVIGVTCISKNILSALA